MGQGLVNPPTRLLVFVLLSAITLLAFRFWPEGRIIDFVYGLVTGEHGVFVFLFSDEDKVRYDRITTATAAASQALLGVLIGTGQWLVLRRWISGAIMWIPATAVGMALATVVFSVGWPHFQLAVSGTKNWVETGNTPNSPR